MYVQRNTAARSRNPFCNENATMRYMCITEVHHGQQYNIVLHKHVFMANLCRRQQVNVLRSSCYKCPTTKFGVVRQIWNFSINFHESPQ